jgi:hypothetical protein
MRPALTIGRPPHHAWPRPASNIAPRRDYGCLMLTPRHLKHHQGHAAPPRSKHLTPTPHSLAHPWAQAGLLFSIKVKGRLTDQDSSGHRRAPNSSPPPSSSASHHLSFVCPCTHISSNCAFQRRPRPAVSFAVLSEQPHTSGPRFAARPGQRLQNAKGRVTAQPQEDAQGDT